MFEEFLILIANIISIFIWKNKQNKEKFKYKFLRRISPFNIYIFIYGLIFSKAFHLIFKFKYFNPNLLIDTINYVTIFAGFGSLIVTLYVYAVSSNDNFKKFILTSLIGEDLLLSLAIYIFTLLFIGVNPIFLVGLTGYLIYLVKSTLTNSMIILNSIKLQENFDNILDYFKYDKENLKMRNIYFELKKNIYNFLVNNDLIHIKESIDFLKRTLERESLLEDIEKTEDENMNDAIKFINSIYGHLLQFPNDEMFKEVHTLHMIYSKFYYRIKNKEGFFLSLLNTRTLYKYYTKSSPYAKTKLSKNVIIGFRFGLLSYLFRDLSKENKEQLDWIIIYNRILFILAQEAYLNNDLEFFQNFIRLIGYHLRFNALNEIHREYKYLEYLSYLGIKLFIDSKKDLIENYNDFNQYILKKLKIRLDELSIEKNKFLSLLEVYDFMETLKIKEKFRWDKIYAPKKELVKMNVEKVDLDYIINKFFFRLFIKYANEVKHTSKENNLERNILILYFDNFIKIKNEFSYDGYFKNICDSLNQSLSSKLNTDKTSKEINENILNHIKDEILKNLQQCRIIQSLKAMNKYIRKEIPAYKRNENLYGIKKLDNKNFYNENYESEIGKTLSENLNSSTGNLIFKSFKQKNIKIEKINLEDLNFDKNEYLIFVAGNYYEFIKNLIDSPYFLSKSNLNEKFIEEYGPLVESSYKNSPIFNINVDEEDVFVVNREDIEYFVHYLPDKLNKNESLLDYATFSLEEEDSFLLGKEGEKIKNSEWLINLSEEEKENALKELVLIKLMQSGEMKIAEGSTVYKIRNQ
ncbi:hypothetical protein [Cetobacterium ceti]